MRALSSSCILALLTVLTIQNLHAQTAQEYYEQGLVLINTGQFGEAVKAFNDAIDRDRKNGDAYFELGKAYTGIHSPTALFFADEAFREAVRYADNDQQKSKYYTG